MTKHVRIENADTSDFKVVVQVWDKGTDSSEAHPGSPDTMVEEILLTYPTQMTGEDVYITSSRYLVIKETR